MGPHMMNPSTMAACFKWRFLQYLPRSFLKLDSPRSLRTQMREERDTTTESERRPRSIAPPLGQVFGKQETQRKMGVCFSRVSLVFVVLKEANRKAPRKK